jgi:hypothetical protein
VWENLVLFIYYIKIQLVPWVPYYLFSLSISTMTLSWGHSIRRTQRQTHNKPHNTINLHSSSQQKRQEWTEGQRAAVHVRTGSSSNRTILLTRRPNPDVAPNQPVTLRHHQLYDVTSPDTALRHAVTQQMCVCCLGPFSFVLSHFMPSLVTV